MASLYDLVLIPALKEIGSLGQNETPTSGEAADALATLNLLLDQWRAERLMLPSITRTTWPIVSGTGTYTVGTGGAINIPRPVYIQGVTFQDSAPTIVTEYPLDPLTDQAYQAIQLKTLTAPYPQEWYYNPTFAGQLGTLTLWMIPTSTTLTGVMYAATAAVTEYTDYTTTVTLPPGWARALVSNLAVDLLPQYERDAHPALVQKASDAKAAVKRSNKRLSDLKFESASLINMNPSWSIYTGP